jgi:tetratricopeptide (TPR) repeat protein
MPQANELKLLHRAVIDAFEHTSPSKWRGIVKEVLERKLDDTRKLYPIQMENPPTGFLEFLEEYADWKRLITPLAIRDESAFGRHFWTNLMNLTRAMPMDELQPYVTECAAMLMREIVATFNSRPLSKAEELNDAGFERHHTEGYKTAIPLHEQAIAAEPRFSLAWINKGIALKNLGKLDEAIACYDHVIQKIDPEYKKAWHNKGVALKEKGKLDAAIQCFDRALELDPDYDIARRVRETCTSLKPGQAMQLGMQMPKNEQAMRLMLPAAELANRGNWVAAAKLYAQALTLEPNNAWLMMMLGEALVESNQIPEAKKHLQRAIELDARCGMAWLNLMRCYLPSRQFDEALRAADQACELMPDFPMAWANRSTALLGLSRFKEAVEAARKSLLLDSRNNVALYNLGVSLWKLNMISEAQEVLDRFVQLYPDSPASESARTIYEWLRAGKR